MGCTNSKLDDLPAVNLCHKRCNFLSSAIHHRYALAEAHVNYLHSLSTVGSSISRFFDVSAINNNNSSIVDKDVSRRRSNSGSHLNFHDSDSSDTDSDDLSHGHEHLHDHSSNSSPIHTYEYNNQYNIEGYGVGNEGLGGFMHYMKNEPSKSVLFEEKPIGNENVGFMEIGGNENARMDMNYMKNEPGGSVLYEEKPIGNETVRFVNFNGNGEQAGRMNMSFMKNEARPSVLYEQRPFGNETVRMDIGESSSSGRYYNNNYANPYPGYGMGNPNANSYYGGGSIGNEFSGPGYYPPVGNLEASSSKPPPPPPSPPRGSGWDFLYPFESTYETYYPPHTPSSRDSKEVREEEGIPDLEYEHEVVKEVYGDHKFSQVSGKTKKKELGDDHVTTKEIKPDITYNNGNNKVAVESEPVEYEVHVVEKKVVGGAERSGDGGNVGGFKASADSDVVREIQVQFERASESGGEIAKILEVGKFPYKKSAAYQVSTKVLQVITPSLPRHPESSAIDNPDPSLLGTDQGLGMRSSNLSSTLHKLYLWEKKLYEEVKVEEKMRVLHERKCRKLKYLDQRGAETHKIDATRTLVRSLSTKIRMAIQVVDKISVTINKLRDEELWPQLNEVIHGLTRMWKAMYECHHIQSQAIAQAKQLDAAAMHKNSSDDQLEATMQLERELISWTVRFSCWVTEQKGFVQSLNNWLMKCLFYVPEDTPDGPVPFSPGRLGAPPIFVICNQWAQAMDRTSENEVVQSMREFAASVLHLWERDKQELHQRMTANKDIERKMKNLEKEDQKIHKEIQALDKRIVLASSANSALPLTGHVVYQSETSKNSSLQLSLQHIFEAMEKFVSNSGKAYEDLLQRIEEDRRDRLERENQRES